MGTECEQHQRGAHQNQADSPGVLAVCAQAIARGEPLRHTVDKEKGY